ncbi:MAG TPA: hypothetical protein VJM31_09675 [Vicinamibacterales bacterium]|nr:hypothetical protein [Vicinamibacterales bacterium]
MPVRKYRSVALMPNAAVRDAGDPRNLRIACDLSATASRLAPRRFPPGVHRYRSIALAAAQRERWEHSSTSPGRPR